MPRSRRVATAVAGGPRLDSRLGAAWVVLGCEAKQHLVEGVSFVRAKSREEFVLDSFHEFAEPGEFVPAGGGDAHDVASPV
jgi:hypothetical protein